MLPGIGVNFAQTATLSWFGGVHKGFSPGSPGSGEVEPEEAVNYEAGLVWNGVAGRIELTGFYSDYSNLTAQCTLSIDSMRSPGAIVQRPRTISSRSQAARAVARAVLSAVIAPAVALRTGRPPSMS